MERHYFDLWDNGRTSIRYDIGGAASNNAASRPVSTTGIELLKTLVEVYKC
jgi:hypothetical protein